MIKAKKNKIIRRFFDIYITGLLNRHFYKIHLFGNNKLSLINSTNPTIIYANHSNWWDGFIAYFLTSKLWKRDDYLMMDIEQMKKYSMFRYIGVFSIDRNNAHETLISLNYAASLIKDSNRFLWIFPQGKMEQQDKRPFEFEGGITRIAEKTGGVNLLPAAFRYEFIMEQRPEVFIRLGEPIIITVNEKLSQAVTDNLRDKLVYELDKLKSDIIHNKLDDYKTVFTGKDSRNKTVDKLTGH